MRSQQRFGQKMLRDQPNAGARAMPFGDFT